MVIWFNSMAYYALGTLGKRSPSPLPGVIETKKKEDPPLKRRFAVLTLVVCIAAACFCMPVSAASAATRLDYTGTVNIDGDCMVTVQMTLHLESAEETLYFPLPGSATGITVNGSSPSTTRAGDNILVNLAKLTSGQPGDFMIQLSYNLPKIVTVAEDRKSLVMTLPILSGFSYPVSTMNYTITLPSEVKTTPNFYSTYRQNGLASELNLVINGSMITGSTKNGFNDHESVSMTLNTETDMFPGVSTYVRTGNPELVPMGILAGLALLYWLVFLRTFPSRKEEAMVPPAGMTAGEVPSKLYLLGPDLTTMVLCWAQLGYILIQVDGRRILLHKRMEMGNERSLFEVRTFQALFGQRRVVDAAGGQYAKLLRRTAAVLPGENAMCRAGERTRNIYRYLLCGVQIFLGICMAMNMTEIKALQILLSLVFGGLGVVTAWQMHKLAFCIGVRKKTGMITAAVSFLLWIVIGLIAGQVWIPLGVCAGQILLGFPAAIGGRRSDLNKHEVAQLRGLRAYLRGLDKEEVQRMMTADPDFFFRMAPYAMALGVLHPYVQAFGKRNLEQCPYLVTRQQGYRKAEDWEKILSDTAYRMDDRAAKMELEKWMAVRFR